MTIRLELLAILKRNTFTDETGFSRALQDELIEDLYDFYNKAIAQAADKREQEVLEALLPKNEIWPYESDHERETIERFSNRVTQRLAQLRQGRAAEGEGKNA